MLKDDYVVEQGNLLTRFLRTILYNSQTDPKQTHLFSENALQLQYHLSQRMHRHQYNEAENDLYDALESANDNDTYRIALWFYEELLKEDKETLEKHQFSYDEVLEGLQDLEKLLLS